VLPYLRACGIPVRCPGLPSMDSPTAAGLAEDARHIAAVAGAIDGPVVLCGHSYGGLVISAADLSRSDARQLVYLCAYLTEAGESMDASLRAAGERRPGHWIRHLPPGRTQVDPGRAAALFYADCVDETRSWAAARLRPQWAQALSGTAAQPNWRALPSTYVICGADRALSPAIQRDVYAVRARRSVTLDSGHAPFLSQPQALAQVLVATSTNQSPQLS
jgi:pimeloyl-ACP methyl ester carboxylesterase